VSKELKKRVQEKFKDLKFKKGEFFHEFNFTTEAGTTFVFVVLKKNIKVVEIQTALRKAILPKLKEVKGGVLLQINHISKANQQDVVNFYSTLTVTGSWKGPVYGLRAKKSASDKKKENKRQKTFVVSQLKDNEISELTAKGTLLGDANNLVRTLASMPSNILNSGKYQD